MAPIHSTGLFNSEVFGRECSAKFGMFLAEPDFDSGAVGSVRANGSNPANAVNKHGMRRGWRDRFGVKGVSIGLKSEVLLGARFGYLFGCHGQQSD